jgi:hypothetical protein
MGIETAFLISAGLSVASGFMQYQQQKSADKAEKRAYEESIRIAKEQAALDKQDAERAAQSELEASDKARKQQMMMYLKSGVDLTGSPLLVMEETRNKGAENAKNVMDSQAARSNLAIQSASSNKPVARASLTSTIAQTGSSLAGSYNDYTLLKKQLA